MNKPRPAVPKNILEQLSLYAFPGNVRELRNMVERAMIYCKGNELTLEDFTIYFKPSSAAAIPDLHPPHSVSLNDLQIKEKQFILDTLKEHNFNQTETASTLGISRDALIRKMKKYGISAHN